MATLEQIQAKMKRLQLQADAMISKKTQAALKQIQALMLKHGLTKDDIEAHNGAVTGGTKRGPKPGAKRAGRSADTAAKKPATSVKGKLPPKYINHKTGETWSGHARPPAWIKDVKDRSKFLIAGASVTADAVVTSRSKAAPKPTSEVTTRSKLPPKYINPKTGATWSGHARPPAWIANVKDRSKFLIVGEVGGGDVGNAAAATKAQVAGNSVGAAKKAVTKKAAAKKAVAKKAVAKKASSAKKVAASKAAPLVKKAVTEKAPAKRAIVATKVVAKSDVVGTPGIVTVQGTA